MPQPDARRRTKKISLHPLTPEQAIGKMFCAQEPQPKKPKVSGKPAPKK